MSLNRFLGSSSDLICVDADASALNASRPSPNSSKTSSIRTISLRDRARRSSVVTRPFPVQSQDFFHSSIERRYSKNRTRYSVVLQHPQVRRGVYFHGYATLRATWTSGKVIHFLRSPYWRCCC